MSVRTENRSARSRLARCVNAWAEALESRTLFAAGDLDLSFGSGGTATTAFGAFSGTGAVANDVVVQQDGQIVVAGENLGHNAVALARYNSIDGSLDTNFGTSGTVTTTTGAGGDSVALDSLGNIVVSGLGPNNTIPRAHAAAFYTPTGALNTALNASGIRTNYGGRAVAVAPGDRWVFGSSTGLEDFDVNGVPTSLPNGNGTVSQVNAVALTTNPVTGQTQVIAAGYLHNGPFSSSLALGRYTIVIKNHKSKVVLDTTFGIQGTITNTVSGGGGIGNASDSEMWSDVAVQPDGKIIAVGTWADDFTGKSGFVMMRFTPNGALDQTFGSSGVVMTTAASGAQTEITSGAGLVIQPADGKIIVAGNGDSNGVVEAIVARYDQNGQIDTSFSGDGFAEIADMKSASAIALGNDGNAIVVGKAAGSGDAKFAVTRILTSTPIPPPQGSANVSSRILTVTGTPDMDRIFVSQPNGSTVRITINGGDLDFDPSTFDTIVINALGGNDQVTVESGVPISTVLNGGAGNDTLNGGDNADTLNGNADDDSLNGGGGNDTLIGSGGNDTLLGANGDDSLEGDAGSDFLNGNVGNDFLDGGANPDNLLGGSGNDTLNGGGGNDHLNGNSGTDSMNGGAGNDIFFAIDSTADTVNGLGGIDTCTQFDSGVDTLISIENQA